MEVSEQIFAILLISGLMLIGAEIFVPGGVLGVIGGIALVGSIIIGFIAFPNYGGYIAVGIIILIGIVIVLWIKIFPKSQIGRKMTVSESLVDAKGVGSGLDELLGKEGKASSSLHPSGFAMIDGRKVDVITEGEMISKGENIKVIAIESNRVIVTETNK